MFHDNRIIAVDIGSNSIKLVYGKSNKKGIYMSNYGMINSPVNTYINGSINDKRGVITAISNLLNTNKIKCNSISFGVNGQDIITRHIEMPIIPEKQLKQAVMLEIEQYLPMDLSQYVIDSKKISKTDSNEKKAYNILLVAVPKNKIDDYFYIADKLNLKVKSIDLFANSSARFFNQNLKSQKDNKGIALINIGYDSTMVTIIEDGMLNMEREISSGILDIDIMIGKAYAKTIDEVSAIRNNIIDLSTPESDSTVSDPRVYYVNNNTRQIIDKLVDEILKVFNFYISDGYDKSIQHVYLYGGGSKLNGIASYINHSLNIDIKILVSEMLHNVYNMEDNFKSDIALYINCISLLSRKE